MDRERLLCPRGRARDDEFLSEEELRKQVRKLRMGNVAGHEEAER
jgi:hypothetical protein